MPRTLRAFRLIGTAAPNWTAWSLVAAVVAWTFGNGGYAFWDSRNVRRPPLPTDYGHDVGLLAASVITLLLVPLIGGSLALLGLLEQPSRRLAAALALPLNVGAWCLPMLARPRGFAWWAGMGVAAAGMVVVGWLVFRRADESFGPRGFSLEPSSSPRREGPGTR